MTVKTKIINNEHNFTKFTSIHFHTYFAKILKYHKFVLLIIKQKIILQIYRLTYNKKKTHRCAFAPQRYDGASQTLLRDSSTHGKNVSNPTCSLRLDVISTV